MTFYSVDDNTSISNDKLGRPRVGLKLCTVKFVVSI